MPGAKCKLTQVMGHFFWEEMSEFEFESKCSNFITKVDNVHTKEELE